MTKNNADQAAVRPVLTDAERHQLLTRANFPGLQEDPRSYLVKITEELVLSKLRAHVADERGGHHFRGVTKMIGNEDLFITHRPVIREAVALLRLRQPATPDFERVASEMEAALDGLPTPAGEPPPKWLEVAALASAPVADGLVASLRSMASVAPAAECEILLAAANALSATQAEKGERDA
ncbi:hypothetical protein [Bordetella hinzii]|uniref:hypothetical protein n=1 Tax=Bordetella hinzii TaxID=103855 RepID=UPI00114F7A8A|nr:hypothetical protein [Bordetella hinzii]QDJ52842.1 hypothetical protein CBR69_22235 [Bordetella hinzii]